VLRRLGLMAALVAMAALFGVGFAGTASAADDCAHRFGSHQQANAGGGVQDWSITNLKVSADPAPGYPLAGQLWEATASVTATSGGSTPVIPNFNASTADRGSYRVLWQMASPQGISGATLAQGQTATGKVYFDVTGSDPIAVTYDAGESQPLMWCCNDAMMSAPPMPMDDCTCCTDPKPCPCCAGKM
jgi:Domain of unknown function (DUF1942)